MSIRKRYNIYLPLSMILKSKSLIIALAFILVLLQPTLNISQAVNWPVDTRIKSGDQKLVITTFVGANSLMYTQYFGQNFISNPNVVIGIRGLQIDSGKFLISFRPKVILPTFKGSFVTNLTVLQNNTINILYNMYIGIEPGALYSYMYDDISFEDATKFTGLNNSTYSMNIKITQNITDYQNAVVSTYITGYEISYLSQWSMSVSGKLSSSNTLTITITSNSTLSKIYMMAIIVDKTVLEIGRLILVDSWHLYSQNTYAGLSSDFSPVTFNYYNLMFGLSTLSMPSNQTMDFFLDPTFTFKTTHSFEYLSYSIIQWRFRQCINASQPYYLEAQQRCYDTCDYNKTVANITYGLCISCFVGCNTCQSDGSTCVNNICSDITRNSSNSCLCNNGYFNNDTSICNMCHYSCLTCIQSATNCLSCPVNRTQIGGSCPCNTKMYDTGNATCFTCSYSCATCRNISTNCTSCNQSAFRVLDPVQQKCFCNSSKKDNNLTQLCINATFECVLPCITCQGSSTNCTSCSLTNKRTLLNSLCVCMDGYSPLNQTNCIDTCGDGRIMDSTTGCDDRNTVSGDGCSSTCQVQSGYQCTGAPSICLYQAGYQISTQSVEKVASSNTIIATFEIVPTPPPQSVPSLLNLNSQLSISSYTLSRSILTLNLAIIGQLSGTQTLSVSLSLINMNGQVDISEIGNFVLKPYTSIYLTLYQVEYYMVWLYIGLLWMGSIAVLILLDEKSFSAILQLFVYTSVAWIGVEGSKTIGLLYEPLLRLRYIFGYNIEYSQKSTLFNVLNLGIILNFVPCLIFFFITLIQKKKPEFVNIKTKKLILYDFSYAWLIINGFMVIYGLSRPFTLQFTVTANSIISIIFGILYISTLLVFSYFLFFKNGLQEDTNPKMEATKANSFKPKFIPIYFLIILSLSFVYLCLQNYTLANSGVLMIVFVLLFLVIGFSSIYVNKLRNILNLISLFLIYACYLLIAQVPSADWGGIVIVILMYLQLIINFLFIFLENRRVKTEDMQDLNSQPSQRQEVKIYNTQSIQGAQGHTSNPSEFKVYDIPNKKPALVEELNMENFVLEHAKSNGLDIPMIQLSGKAERYKLTNTKLTDEELMFTTIKKPNFQQEGGFFGDKQVNMDSF